MTIRVEKDWSTAWFLELGEKKNTTNGMRVPK